MALLFYRGARLRRYTRRSFARPPVHGSLCTAGASSRTADRGGGLCPTIPIRCSGTLGPGGTPQPRRGTGAVPRHSVWGCRRTRVPGRALLHVLASCGVGHSSQRVLVRRRRRERSVRYLAPAGRPVCPRGTGTRFVCPSVAERGRRAVHPVGVGRRASPPCSADSDGCGGTSRRRPQRVRVGSSARESARLLPRCTVPQRCARDRRNGRECTPFPGARGGLWGRVRAHGHAVHGGTGGAGPRTHSSVYSRWHSRAECPGPPDR